MSYNNCKLRAFSVQMESSSTAQTTLGAKYAYVATTQQYVVTIIYYINIKCCNIKLQNPLTKVQLLNIGMKIMKIIYGSIVAFLRVI